VSKRYLPNLLCGIKMELIISLFIVSNRTNLRFENAPRGIMFQSPWRVIAVWKDFGAVKILIMGQGNMTLVA